MIAAWPSGILIFRPRCEKNAENEEMSIGKNKERVYNKV
jgi:hypothetical protein